MSENKLDEARLARIHEAFASVPYAKFLGVRAGRRLFVLSVEVMDDQQRMVATAVTTYIKLQ